ncbi:hypothetical protein LCGC14_2487930 [marine sediment metagenome]|uniref:Uncharacterized protein n=1 Tax=marine sediment metagenome TaxID=412755 RepID=A0A0F9B5P8_9ZZZZ
MDKRTKRRMDKEVSEFEKACLMEMLFESEDENVRDALEQALLVVKLIHSEEIAEEVENHRQKLIEEAKNKKVELKEFERILEQMERDLGRRDQDMWKKQYDYWDDNYLKRSGWMTDRWITTTTVSTDKSPKVITNPATLLNEWSTKLDKK